MAFSDFLVKVFQYSKWFEIAIRQTWELASSSLSFLKNFQKATPYAESWNNSVKKHYLRTTRLSLGLNSEH